jgi:hypothetical protein
MGGMLGDDLRLPGAPESLLSDEQLAALPTNAAPAPWRLRASALVWTGRPDGPARAALAEIVPGEISVGATPIATVGALINYLWTPVGRYSEIIGMVVYRRGGSLFTHVPFIAVDSATSVVGGRANWALPKVLATFEGRPVDRVPMTAEGPSWRVTATPRASRVPLPMFAPKLVPMVQLTASGSRCSARPVGYGLVRPARVEVRVAGETAAEPSLASWFPAGSRTGVLGAQLSASLGAPVEMTAPS